MDFAAGNLGFVVTKRIPVAGSLNASIQDETLDIVTHVGRLAELAKEEAKDPAALKQSKLRLVKIIESAQHGLREVEEMERSQ